jgi:hypothetical protein
MRLRHIVPALCGGALLLACGFADLFSSGQVGNVVLTYTGPTTLSVDERAAVSVTVTIDGAVIPNPRLAIVSSDPTILTLSGGGDTLVAVSRGFDSLTIKLVASIYTDSFPTIRKQIRVSP